jgi:hypothetical protein
METGYKTFVALTLLLVFFIIVITFLFTSFGPRAINTLDYYILSPLGLKSKEFPKFAEASFLDAKITVAPEGLVCTGEPVFFSANNSKLPKGISLSDVKCYWDFDFNISNGWEAFDCDANYSGSWPPQGLEENNKVTLLLVEPSGKSDNATIPISSALECAFCTINRGCSGIKFSNLNKEIYNGDTINITFDPTPLDISYVKDIHLIVETKSQQSDLKVWMCGSPSSRTQDYEFVGNLTNPTIVYGQNLVYAIDNCNCVRNPCNLSLTFYFKGNDAIKIKEIWIPLSASKFLALS